MRTLHLCAGHGGGLLASLLLGHSIVGAVEYDDFAQRVLRARQRDGLLPAFPIHSDLRSFDGRPWRGAVDLVAGGIPCQGFSGAGKQLGEHDPRNLWPDAIRVLRETRAPWFFLENVDRLTSFDYWGVILQDLAAAGYDARWCVLAAGEVGAPHLRKRIWLLATDTDAFRQQLRQQPGRCGGESGAGAAESGEHGEAWRLADAAGQRLEDRTGAIHGHEAERSEGFQEAGGGGNDVGHADGIRREGGREESAHADPGSPDEERGVAGQLAQSVLGGMADGLADRLDRPGWWAVERGLPRVAGKQPNRAERLRGCGNGQVALCAAAAYRLLGGP